MSTEDDQVWFSELYKAQQDRLVCMAVWQLAGDQAAACDVVHDVFVEAWRKHARLRAMKDPGAWLRKTLINKLRNRRRRAWLRRERSTAHQQLPHTPDSQVWKGLDVSARADLAKAVGGLRPSELYLLLQVAVHNRTYDDVAQEISSTGEAVRKKVKRAVDKVRDHLPPKYLFGDHGDE